MSNIKKKFEEKWLIKIVEITDKTLLPNINSILEESFADVMSKSDFHFTNYSDFTESLECIMDNGGKIFVAKYMGKVVGTIAMEITEIDKWYHTGRIVKLCHLGVLPKYQNHGLGKILVNKIRQEAEALDLPITFCTPEKNVGTIKFYERMGAAKVRFFKANDHYTVRFMFFNDDKFTAEYCQKEYEKSAYACLMKNWKVCSEIADTTIRETWLKDFLPIIREQDDETVMAMRRQYRKHGTMPKEYLKKRKEKEKHQAENPTE